ncbi:MAG: hypothetical protein N3G21_05950, partial [Candidatus Hydrogenedentes bacterium]|nr:hypothetical protein [Candidatus Hydrogenedentota bacterium]
MKRLRQPWQAILWEELSVSGSISFALIFIEVWIAYLIHFTFPDWEFYVWDLEVVTYFFPALNGLLLVLTRGNQGELRGGFQKRLLFLPTYVISSVSIILFTRLFLILIHTIILRSVCIYFFAIPYELSYGGWKYTYTDWEMIAHHEMLINLSTDGCIYLLLQFLSWVFHWSKGIFILIIMVVVSLILRI